MKYTDLYQQFQNMTDIPEDEWAYVEDYFTAISFKKGDHIVRSGDNSEYLYIILNGLTRSYYIDKEGKEFNKIFLSNGEIASAYVEQLQGVPARLNIQAMEKTETLAIKYEIIRSLYPRHLCWNVIGRKIAEDYFILKEKREYEFLLLDAAKRYENFLADYKNLLHRIPQYHVAAYLGITPVSLSRIINAKKDH